MVQILIRCPACQKNGFIEVEQNATKNVTRGLLAVNIEVNTICEHSFIIYLDKNLKLRDYFIADFQIQIPKLETIENKKEIDVPDSKTINLDLIKLNLPATLITYIIKSILYKKKIVLILEETFLYNHIINFFKYINQNAFEFDLSLITKEEYISKKKFFKDYMLFEGTKIINNINKIIDPKKLKVEKKIVQTFMAEVELSTSLILLKNEINKTYLLSKSIVDFIKSHEEAEKINITKILEHLEDEHNLKVDTPYLNYLGDVVENYFDIKVPILYDSFLGFL